MVKEETEKTAENITAETKDEYFTDVESSAFSGFHYDAEAKTIEIKFADGDIYKYGDEENPYTPELHEKFLAAKSKGSFLNNHIKKLPFADLTVRTAKVEKPEDENAPIEPANGIFNSDGATLETAQKMIDNVGQKAFEAETTADFNGDGVTPIAVAEIVNKDDLLKEAEEKYLAEQKRIIDGAQTKYDAVLTEKVMPGEKLEFTDDGYAKYPDFDKIHPLDFLNDKAEKMIRLFDEERQKGGKLPAESKAQIGLCELEPNVTSRYVVTLRADGTHSKELI